VERHAAASRSCADRLAKVERELQGHPGHRVAFDVVDVPLAGSAEGESVSVVLAVRHGDHILSGELRVPRERWDMAAFVAVVDPSAGAQ